LRRRRPLVRTCAAASPGRRRAWCHRRGRFGGPRTRPPRGVRRRRAWACRPWPGARRRRRRRPPHEQREGGRGPGRLGQLGDERPGVQAHGLRLRRVALVAHARQAVAPVERTPALGARPAQRQLDQEQLQGPGRVREAGSGPCAHSERHALPLLPDERMQPVFCWSSAAAAPGALPALRQPHRTAQWPGRRDGVLVDCRPARQANVADAAGARAVQAAAQVESTGAWSACAANPGRCRACVADTSTASQADHASKTAAKTVERVETSSACIVARVGLAQLHSCAKGVQAHRITAACAMTSAFKTQS